MPSWPAATPSVSMQPPSKMSSSFAPAGMMLLSPTGAGKVDGSAACAATEKASRVPRTAAPRLNIRKVSIIPPVVIASVEALDFGYRRDLMTPLQFRTAIAMLRCGCSLQIKWDFKYKNGVPACQHENRPQSRSHVTPPPLGGGRS